MAKITARGARENARAKFRLPNSANTYVFVMCSDGRILAKPDVPRATYSLYAKGIPIADRNMHGLLIRIQADGYSRVA